MKEKIFRKLLLFSLSLIALTASATIADAQQVFNKGDRVLASPSSLKDEKYWRPCTVTEVHNFTPKRAYSLTCDPQTAGGSPSSYTVNQDWVKPLPAEAAPTDDTNNNQPANNRNQADDNAQKKMMALPVRVPVPTQKPKTIWKNLSEAPFVKTLRKNRNAEQTAV